MRKQVSSKRRSRVTRRHISDVQEHAFMKPGISPAGITCGQRAVRRWEVREFILYYVVGRNSSVGIATRYELDGPGIESR
jgi:hypothetical protein